MYDEITNKILVKRNRKPVEVEPKDLTIAELCQKLSEVEVNAGVDNPYTGRLVERQWRLAISEVIKRLNSFVDIAQSLSAALGPASSGRRCPTRKESCK